LGLEVDNAKRKHRCKMCKFLERESAKKGFPKSGKCQCNRCYTHLSSFRHFRLVERCAKRARETFGFSTRLSLRTRALSRCFKFKIIFYNTQAWLSARVRPLSKVCRSEKLQLSLSQAMAGLAKMMHLKYRGACAYLIRTRLALTLPQGIQLSCHDWRLAL